MVNEIGNPIPIGNYIKDTFSEEQLKNPNLYTQVERKIIYQLGQDIAKWGVVVPFSLAGNQKSVNSILNMFDGDGSTYWEIQQTGAASATSTFIMDFSISVEIRGILMSYLWNAGAAGVKNIKIYTSNDGINYNLVKDRTSGASDEWHDEVFPTTTIRSFKFEVTMSNIGSTTQIYQLSFIV